MAHKTQRNISVTRSPVYYKKIYNLATARWKRCIGQGKGKEPGPSMPSPGGPLSPNLHVFTNLEALRTLSLWVFTGALLHSHDGDWFNLQALSPPQGRSGSGNENSNPLNTRLVILATSPMLRWGLKVTLLTYKRHLCHSHHLGNSKGFGSCEPVTVEKD